MLKVVGNLKEVMNFLTVYIARTISVVVSLR